jgi:hypothetical protein
LKWYDEGGENQKRFLKLNCFSPLKILSSPLFEETLGAFIFLPLFFFSSFFSFFQYFFSLFFFAPSLEDLGVLMIFEEKITSSKTFFSNGLTWNGMVMTVDIMAVDTYCGMKLCTSI